MDSSRQVSQVCYHMRHVLRTVGKDDVVIGAEELRYAADALGKVTGAVELDDILDAVFRSFCIGK